MKNGLFEKYFRLKFGAKLCLLVLVGMTALTSATYFFTSRSLGDTYGEAIYTIYDLKVRIFPLIFASYYSIAILAVVTVAIAVIAVFFSHKIAGPLYRLERSLEAIGSGDLTVVTHFRGDDQLKALADDINVMVRSLNHLSRGCHDAVEGVRRAEENLSALLARADADPETLRRAAGELGEAIGELRKATAFIRTGR